MTLQEKIHKKAEEFEKLAPVFLEGAEFALSNQWISIEDDLPCNHEELISVDELKRLKACAVTLYAYQSVKGLCPICGRAMLLEGLICPNCDYDNSSSVEDWKQMHEDEN